MHNLDDYAWYEVGGKRFYNKLQAVMEAKKTGQSLYWNVNDAIFDQYKWDKEPESSLDELYAKRAQGIRDKYDYLVLHFSGGSDSGNILETFIKNRIHIDEIVTRGSYSVTTPKTGVVSAADIYSECLGQAIPLAQWAKDTHMPHVKIRLIDTVDTVQKFYKTNPDWIELYPTALTPSSVIKSNLDILHTDYARMADKGIRVGHIVGVDKPHIYKQKNYYYTRCHDQLEMDWVCVPHSISYRPQFVELFYWGIHAVEMRIKQLHVLKRHIKQDSVPFEIWDWRQGRPHERWVASCIYNRSMPLLTEHEKDITTTLVKDRDWYFARDTRDQSFVNYTRGIKQLSQEINPEYWHTPENFWRRGIKMMFSKPRFLGP